MVSMPVLGDTLDDDCCYGRASPVPGLMKEKAIALLGCSRKAAESGDVGAEPRRMTQIDQIIKIPQISQEAASLPATFLISSVCSSNCPHLGHTGCSAAHTSRPHFTSLGVISATFLQASEKGFIFVR